MVAAAVQVADAAGFEWLKWVPHVRSSTSPLDGDHLAVGPDATRRLLARLLGVAADRSERAASSDQRPGLWPRVLVLLQEATEPDRALLSQLLEVAPHLGINLVWLGESRCRCPASAGPSSRCPGYGRPGLLSHTDPEVPDRLVELDGVRPDTALAVARALAPLRDASAGNETTAIPRVVPLLDALGIDLPTGDGIAAGVVGAPALRPVVPHRAGGRRPAPPRPRRAGPAHADRRHLGRRQERAAADAGARRCRPTTRRAGSTSCSSTTRAGPAAPSSATCPTRSAT